MSAPGLAGRGAKRMVLHAAAEHVAAATAHKPARSVGGKPAGLAEGTTELGSGAFVDFHPLSLPDAAAAFAAVDQEVAWGTGEIFVYGRTVLQPRQFSYQADRPASNPDLYAYTYSKRKQARGTACRPCARVQEGGKDWRTRPRRLRCSRAGAPSSLLRPARRAAVVCRCPNPGRPRYWPSRSTSKR